MVGNLLKLSGNKTETKWKGCGMDVERMWKQYGNEMEMEISFYYPVALDTGLASPVLLIPPSHFVTPGDSERSTASPPTRTSTPQPAPASPRASVIRSTASEPAPSLPPRGPSPIIEPDTSHIGQEEEVPATKKLELGFRVNIASHFQHEATKISKSYDYSCSCLQRKSLCSCSEAVLEVHLKLRYRLFKEA